MGSKKKSHVKKDVNQPRVKTVLSYLEEQTITVDGLQFETLISPNLLLASSQKEDVTSEIFGVRLTNLGEKPYRFIFYCLLPQVFDENRQPIKILTENNKSPLLEPSDFIEIAPENSYTYWLEARINVSAKGEVNLRGHDGRGCLYWSLKFPDFSKDYYFQFTYQKNKWKILTILLNRYRTNELQEQILELVEQMWEGIVIMPLVQFRLDCI